MRQSSVMTHGKIVIGRPGRMSTTAFRAIGVLVRDSPIEKFHIDRIEIALMRLNMKALRALTPVLLAMQGWWRHLQ
jgi:hypothetical protein